MSDSISLPSKLHRTNMANDPMPKCDLGCEVSSCRMKFTIPADVNQITGVVDRVIELAEKEMGADTEKPMAIGLALQEAMANAVVHGSGCNPAKQVQCWVAYDHSHGMTIVVSDTGPGFHVEDVPGPLGTEGMKKDHGRGVYLIRQLMDSVHFQNEGREIHMTKK